MNIKRLIKRGTHSLIWKIKFFSTARLSKKWIKLQKDEKVIFPIVYCSIWQDRSKIQDIIEWKQSPKNDQNRALSWATSLDDYERWSWQICGITSFQMYLETRKIPYLWGNISLVYESLLYGTYKYNPYYHGKNDYHISPMHHQWFIDYVRERYQLRAKSLVWIDLLSVIYLLQKGKFILLSLNQNIRSLSLNTKYLDSIGRHIVVLTGYKIEKWALSSIFIHNSSGYTQDHSQENYEIPFKIAQKVFAWKIITID